MALAQPPAHHPQPQASDHRRVLQRRISVLPPPRRKASGHRPDNTALPLRPSLTRRPRLMHHRPRRLPPRRRQPRLSTRSAERWSPTPALGASIPTVSPIPTARHPVRQLLPPLRMVRRPEVMARPARRPHQAALVNRPAVTVSPRGATVSPKAATLRRRVAMAIPLNPLSSTALRQQLAATGRRPGSRRSAARPAVVTVSLRVAMAKCKGATALRAASVPRKIQRMARPAARWCPWAADNAARSARSAIR